MASLATIMERVQNLLNKAESTEFPAEASAYRAKAEELMRSYRIAEEDLIASDPSALEPVMDFITVCGESEFQGSYSLLLIYAAEHAGVRVAQKWERTVAGWEVRAAVVGYESDIRLLQMIYGAARLAFQNRLEPAFDEKLSTEENIYRLRSAGWTRKKVSILVLGLDTHAGHARVGTIYKEQCRLRGEEPALDGKGITLKTFRGAYSMSFAARFSSRLREARDAADSIGGAIQLHGRQERVEEAFYGFFPERRPAAVPATQESRPAIKERKTTKKDRDDYRRKYLSAAAKAGSKSGRLAAEEVELDRPTPTSRLQESGFPSSAPTGEIAG